MTIAEIIFLCTLVLVLVVWAWFSSRQFDRHIRDAGVSVDDVMGGPWA